MASLQVDAESSRFLDTPSAADDNIPLLPTPVSTPLTPIPSATPPNVRQDPPSQHPKNAPGAAWEYWMDRGWVWGFWAGVGAIVVAIFSRLLSGQGTLFSSPACESALSHGRWQPGPPPRYIPDSCYLYPYTKKESLQCLASSRVVFIGDSTARDVYNSLKTRLVPGASTAGEKHADLQFDAPSDVRLEFFWDPFLNRTTVHDMEITNGGKTTSNAKNRNALMVYSAGYWFMKYSTDRSGGLNLFKRNLDMILDGIGKAGHGDPVADETLIRPINPLVAEKLDKSRRKSMTMDRVNAYNLHLRRALGTPRSPEDVHVPEYVYRLYEAAAVEGKTKDGFHYDANVLASEVDLVLNRHCNRKLFRGPSAPGKATCCVIEGWPDWKQFAFLGVLAFFGPLAWWCRMGMKRWGDDSGKQSASLTSRLLPSETNTLLLSKLWITLVYIFAADRTFIFPRINKQFTTFQFTILTLAYIIAGLLTLRRQKDTAFLNRHQTDEWKGWMQLAILVYHYTGASKVAVIYNAIRVLVASYLFMTGYGHFTFFYLKSDFSFIRVARVLVRLNLLSIAMACVTGRDALFYYFGPLVSFWFLVVYVTMAVGHTRNASTPFLLAKLAVSALCCSIFINYPPIIRTIWGVLASTLNVNWDVHESTFRLALDQWIVYAGMLTALFALKLNKGVILSSIQSDPSAWSTFKRRAILVSGVTLVAYALFESSFSENKFAYNKWHAYVSVPAVVAFTVLRNATAGLRATTSRFWCWVGAFSLETFLLQYHIWLGVDTKGLLVVWPGGGWWGNFVVASVVFFAASEVMGDVTGRLVEWVVGKDKKWAVWRVLGWWVVLIVWNLV
ncbi:hypothetical protein HK104_010663 [Borealophlyctis nickersoniae]|nr:hypothetical protein HK104_010663 [Borealophlyctis nickersoniae]